MTQPISDSAFAKLMAALGPFESAPHLAVAVSGGSDSLALLLLLKTWIDARQGRLTALSVDHGLRPEAAAECRQVGALIAAINAGHGQTTSGRAIAHEILTWQGAKPRHGVMAAARTARYRLLVAWCRAHDVLHLALGHHADDQAETVLMRQAHGSSTFGLAGMAGIRALGGVRLLRPLLSRRKTELTALVAAAGLAWIDDPSNASRRFERVRWRQELGPEADITAQLQQAAQRIAQGVNAWMGHGAKATEQRVARENQLATHHNALTQHVYKQFSAQQDELFARAAPEMADSGKAHELRTATQKMLRDVGFADDEVQDAWKGKTGVPLRDHRVQLLLRDAAMWRQAQARANQVTRAPIPPVQRPGTFRPRGAGNEEQVSSVRRQLETATGDRAVRLATKLYQLQRAG